MRRERGQVTAEVTLGGRLGTDAGFRLTFAEADPHGALEGTSVGEVEFTPARLLALFARALTAPGAVNYVSCRE